MGRDLRLVEIREYLCISTHTPAWSVTDVGKVSPFCNNYFNSHARVERDFFCRVYGFLCFYFNSHARVGRDN